MDQWFMGALIDIWQERLMFSNFDISRRIWSFHYYKGGSAIYVTMEKP